MTEKKLYDTDQIRVVEFRRFGRPPLTPSGVSYRMGYEEFQITIKPDHSYATPRTCRILMVKTDDGSTAWEWRDGYMVFAMTALEHSEGIVNWKQDRTIEQLGFVGAEVFWFGATPCNGSRRDRRYLIFHDKEPEGDTFSFPERMLLQ